MAAFQLHTANREVESGNDADDAERDAIARTYDASDARCAWSDHRVDARPTAKSQMSSSPVLPQSFLQALAHLYETSLPSGSFVLAELFADLTNDLPRFGG